MEITLPYKYEPREYQRPVKRYLEQGGLRAVCVWHRRSGKDKTGLNIVIPKMMERIGSYYYFFPTYNQGKKIMWDGMDKSGMRFLDHFPPGLIDKKNDSEMKIIMKKGSLFQVVGTDNYNSIMGTNPIGCVFSEYSLQNPVVWDYIRPILRENGGWALFLYTPRSRNHGYNLLNIAKKNKDWFWQVLTVDDTKAITPAEIQQERNEGMDEDLIQQEYYCSFEGAVHGSYYSKQIKQAEREKRIGNIPWVEQISVDTYWDLGIDDAMAIWFVQSIGKEIRIIDYEEDSGEGLGHYVKLLKEKPYVYGEHNAPFDIKVRELTTGKSRLEAADSLGLKFKIVPQLPVDDGINAVRMIFSQCWFDEKKCEKGLNSLREYHKEYDEERKCFKNHPYHDWSSHGADAFRELAVGHKEKIKQEEMPYKEPIFDPYYPNK